MIQWLRLATLLGCKKASAWYERINIAMGNTPTGEIVETLSYQEFEQQWRDLPNEGYLLARIHFFRSLKRQAIRKEFSSSFSQGANSDAVLSSIYHMPTFNRKHVDKLNLLHAAALADHEVSLSHSLSLFASFVLPWFAKGVFDPGGPSYALDPSDLSFFDDR